MGVCCAFVGVCQLLRLVQEEMERLRYKESIGDAKAGYARHQTRRLIYTYIYIYSYIHLLDADLCIQSCTYDATG